MLNNSDVRENCDGARWTLCIQKYKYIRTFLKSTYKFRTRFRVELLKKYDL